MIYEILLYGGIGSIILGTTVYFIARFMVKYYENRINRFNKDRKKTLNYIQQEVLRDAPKVPTMVIKAEGKNYSEVTDKDSLGVFLPQVKFIKAYVSKSSKQNWFIDLKSGEDTLTMKMSIRTNKAGHPGVKKLGQFSLAVKYNGLES